MQQTMAVGSVRSQNIHLRVAPRQRHLIDQAAKVTGKTRSEYILDVVTKEAENTLLDQRIFLLDAEQWRAFNEVLDAPANPSEALLTLMATEPVWK